VQAEKTPGAGAPLYIQTSFVAQVLDSRGGGGEKVKEIGQPGKVPGAPQMDQGQKQGGKRSGWNPIGEIAGRLFGGTGGKGGKDVRGGGGGLQVDLMKLGKGFEGYAGKGKADPGFDFGPEAPRTEFFILFVWTEPILEESETGKR